MNKLRHYRELREMTQTELAKRAKISQPMIARMEHEPDHPSYRGMSGEHAICQAVNSQCD
jgi:predicted transcriptional regulator